MNGLFAKEYISVFEITELYLDVRRELAYDHSYILTSNDIVLDLLSWGVSKAFYEITGLVVSGFTHSQGVESVYYSVRSVIESFTFKLVADIGTSRIREQSRYNLVVTKERLYFIIS